MDEKITALLEEYLREHNKNVFFYHWREENGKEIDFCDEFEQLCKDNNIKQYDTLITEVFDSPGYTADIISFAWVDENGKLWLDAIASKLF